MKKPSTPRNPNSTGSIHNRQHYQNHPPPPTPAGVTRNVSRQWTFVTQELSSNSNNSQPVSRQQSARVFSSSGLRCATAQASSTSARLQSPNNNNNRRKPTTADRNNNNSKSNSFEPSAQFASWFSSSSSSSTLQQPAGQQQQQQQQQQLISRFSPVVDLEEDNKSLSRKERTTNHQSTRNWDDEQQHEEKVPTEKTSVEEVHRTNHQNKLPRPNTNNNNSKSIASHVVLQPLSSDDNNNTEMQQHVSSSSFTSMPSSSSFAMPQIISSTSSACHLVGDATTFGGAGEEPDSPQQAARFRSNRRAEREKRIAQMQHRFDERRNHFVNGVCNGVAIDNSILGGAWTTPKPIRDGPKPTPVEINLESVSMAGEMLIPKISDEALNKEKSIAENWKNFNQEDAEKRRIKGTRYDHMPIPKLRVKVPFKPSAASMTASLRKTVQKYVETGGSDDDEEGNDNNGSSPRSPASPFASTISAFNQQNDTTPTKSSTSNGEPKSPAPKSVRKSRLVKFEDEDAEQQQQQQTEEQEQPVASVRRDSKFDGWKRLRTLASVGMTSKLKMSQSPTRPTKDRTTVGIGKEMTEYDRKMEAAEQRIHGESVAEIARRKLHSHVQKFISILDDIKEECGFESGTVECARLEQVGEALRIRHVSLLYESLHTDGKELISPLTELDASSADPELLRALKHEKTLREAESHWRTILGGAYSGTAHISSTTTPWSALPGVNKHYVIPKTEEDLKEEEEEQSVSEENSATTEEEKDFEIKSVEAEEGEEVEEDEEREQDEETKEQEDAEEEQRKLKRRASERLDSVRPRKLVTIEPAQLLQQSIQSGQDIEEPEVMCRLAEMHAKALGKPPPSVFGKSMRVLI